MAAVKTKLGGLLLVHLPICLDSGLPVRYELIHDISAGPEWMATRNLLYFDILPYVPLPELRSGEKKPPEP